ncbi:MAG: hypothetical protein DRP70_10885 [Spirochaetes bacterium]|nr:MAG: hypothetical protein DRP70_10885 [Spirochaetota bacterium]
MILDGHIHITHQFKNENGFTGTLKKSGIDGGVCISLAPREHSLPWEDRLKDLFLWIDGNPLLFPFYWVNPLDESAGEQIQKAVELGVKGIKIICDSFYPGDEKALKIYDQIASLNLPILFHSGILWDGKVSSEFNRPAGFEVLLDVPNLRFSMAHMGWPWTDEYLAVYGKFLNSRSAYSEETPEMFIDTTPGTPEIYRNEALTKLYGIGYDVADNVIFGSDSSTDNYNGEWVNNWIKLDNSIHRRNKVSEETIGKSYHNNLLRFISGEKKQHKALKVGEN